VTTDALTTRVLNRIRRHIAGNRPREVPDTELWQFCRDHSDAELLTIDHVGATALRAVRDWSVPPQETVTRPAEPVSPSTARTPVRLPRLRAIRTSRGLSVRELARASGLTPGMIDVLECLERRAGPNTVRKLAQALGVEPGELVGDDQ
jgi:hypothetical protein